MKKQYVGMGVLVLVVIAAGWYFVGSKEPKAAPVVTPEPATTTPATTTTEVATGTTSAPTTSDKIELDLTKLQGKDRLYTEEEGKYENLSEEEQKLLEKVRCPGRSFTFDYSGRKKNVTRPCDKVQRNVKDFFRLVTLKNNIAVAVEPPDGMNSGWIHIYDIKSDTRIETIMVNDYAFGPEYIIRKRPLYLYPAEGLGSTGDKLDYYRPGMTGFAPIPNSEPLSPELGYVMSGLVFDGYIFTIKSALDDCDHSEIGYPINCVRVKEKTQTFDLSNLP
jgi:hypothetical protein